MSMTDDDQAYDAYIERMRQTEYPMLQGKRFPTMNIIRAKRTKMLSTSIMLAPPFTASA